MDFKKELTLFDLTNIIVGSVIGADIYIASAITAGMLGPFSLVIWIIAGIFATIIALVFAYCSYYVPKVGGPFAYVSAAFDDFYGFLTGWSLWIAELLSLPVFAIAFVRYLEYLLPLDTPWEILVKGIFLLGLTSVNILGVKMAGRVNDVLTLIKLLPLLLLIGGGIIFFIIQPFAVFWKLPSLYSPWSIRHRGRSGSRFLGLCRIRTRDTACSRGKKSADNDSEGNNYRDVHRRTILPGNKFHCVWCRKLGGSDKNIHAADSCRGSSSRDFRCPHHDAGGPGLCIRVE